MEINIKEKKYCMQPRWEIKEKDLLNNIFYFCLTLFLISFSDSILFMYNSNNAIVALGQYAMVAFSILSFLICLLKQNSCLSKDYLLLFIAILFVVFSAVYHSEFTGGYISRIALFILGFCVCKICDIKKIMYMYQKIMMLICLFSLVGFVIMSVYGPLVFLPKVVNTGGRTFYWFGFSFMTTGTPVRNYGIFTEPSRFQAYINLSFIIEFFCNERKLNLKRVSLLGITLLTTYSTTGFISFGVIFLAFILSKKSDLSIFKKVMLIISFVGIIVLVGSLTDLFSSSISKIEGGEDSESYSVRFNSLFGGIKMISEHFWLGTGVENANKLFIEATKNLYSVRAKTTYTNTLLMCVSKFGIVPGVYYICNLFQTLKSFSKSRFIAAILFFALFCMLSGISFIDSIMFNVLVFMHLGLKNKSVIPTMEANLIPKFPQRVIR